METISDPLVSVIIPVYNVAPYLREALDSVVNQSYRNLEIIVIDDGSTDDSGSICDEYKHDSRVQVIHQENRGLSGARNTGLDRMTGEYVAFLDSDDAFTLQMIERMVSAIQRTNADLVVCGYEVYKTEGQLYKKQWPYDVFQFKSEELISSREALNRLIARKLTICVWDKVYKKKIWENIRFPKGYVYEDVFVILHVLESCGMISIVSKSYVLHRERGYSITKTCSNENINYCLMAYRYMEEYINKRRIFLRDNILLFQEKTAGLFEGYYSALREKEPVLAERCRTESLRYLSMTNGYHQHLKAKVARILIEHFPWLITPIRMCWQQGKRLLIVAAKRFFQERKEIVMPKDCE